MKPGTIWALVVIGIFTIGASTTLAITGHSIDPVIITLSTGASLLTATGLLAGKQEKNATQLNAIQSTVNGNTTKLIDANTHLASQIGVPDPGATTGPTVSINGQEQALTTPPAT